MPRDRLFLIGNGPSLTARDLDMIAGEHSMAMNGIADIFPETRWRPTYYVTTSSGVRWPGFAAKCQRGARAAKHAWATKYVDLRSDNVTGVTTYGGAFTVDDIDDTRWSDDQANVCKWATTMLPAMQIAATLGYGTFVLLGVDADYSAQLHFNSDEEYYADLFLPDEATRKQNDVEQIMAYEVIAKPNLERLGINVLNATRGGRVEVWPRVSLEAVLESP